MKTELLTLAVEGDHLPRLDKFLADAVSELSRARLQALIAEGKVKVDGLVALKPALKLEDGQQVEIEIPKIEPDGLASEDLSLEVIYIDESVIVLNKPAGMVVHPGAGNQAGTLVNGLLYRWPEIADVGETGRPGIVHRLDKETSGVLMVARNEAAYLWLVKQFKSRRTKKSYLALVDGHPPTPTGRIEAAVGRDERFRQKMAVTYAGKGRAGITEYHTVEAFTHHALLEVRPHTGRTHQIRVHLAYLGCPVTGDKVYGRRKPSLPIDRFFLHASKLQIVLPGETEPTEFVAPLPADLLRVLDTVRDME